MNQTIMSSLIRAQVISFSNFDKLCWVYFILYSNFQNTIISNINNIV